MPSSSLIFVIIVALWAAFLLQHWIRRREALATARSVDRFSEGIRVLKRRGPVMLAMQSENESARTSLRAGHVVVPATTQAPVTDDGVEVARPSTRTGSHAVRLRGTAWKMIGRVTGRQVKAGALLASLALLVLSVVLTPFGVTPWWSPVLFLVVTAGVVAWLRSAKLSQSRAARASRSTADVQPTAQAEPTKSTATPAAAATAAPAARDSFYDAQAVEAQFAPAARVANPVEGGWEPVSVPRPTYTMKAKALRAPVTVETAAPGTGADLPFDGLAFDEDLEELPPVYRAG